MAEVKEKPKGLLGKLKEAAEDKEEQIAILATLIRVIVLVWSTGILTLNYVKIPESFMMQEKKLIRPSCFSVHRNFSLPFGVQTGGKKNGAGS